MNNYRKASEHGEVNIDLLKKEIKKRRWRMAELAANMFIHPSTLSTRLSGFAPFTGAMTTKLERGLKKLKFEEETIQKIIISRGKNPKKINRRWVNNDNSLQKM